MRSETSDLSGDKCKGITKGPEKLANVGLVPKY